MKRKNLAACGLVVFFLFGVVCSTMAAPAQSIPSVADCSQIGGAMAMTECEHPSYLCGFDRPSSLFSAVPGSARSDDLLKNALSLTIGEARLAGSNDAAMLLAQERAMPSVPELHKVSIRLFNSILNL